MSLINCRECGKEISDLAVACPHCGAPVINQNNVSPNQFVPNQYVQQPNFQPNVPKKQSESGLGIAGLVLGCLGIIPLFAILGFIFSLIGLCAKDKKSVCGTIGIILSGIFLILWIIL